ncbi:hypothetical protein [Lutimonas vermicola]|uniref:Uncharacterized protein n=1 Tax=Lutimonas vermicola TaxID=414288 RepID=A0ABU9KZ20_9FLAO
MSKNSHFRILAGIILITSILSVMGYIQGFEIVTFSLLGIAGVYFSFFFIKYVYAQKDYPVIPNKDQQEL